MFNKITNTIKNKINTIKETNDNYKQLLETTKSFEELIKIPENNQKPPQHKKNFITNNCPDINDTKANIISNLITLEETILEAFYAKEIKTNKEIFIIPTNKQIWVITTEEYKILPYTENNISIIKNNLMSKTILLNNILLEINGNNDKINILINLLTNNEEKEKIIYERTKYLCGIIPIYQNINSINSGISLDINNNIVIHTAENNYKYNVNQITYYEILLDNQVYYSKDSYSKNSMPMSKSSCFTISIKLTIDNNEQINIPILKTNDFGTKYDSIGTTFQTNIAFATEIIKKIEELILPKY